MQVREVDVEQVVADLGRYTGQELYVICQSGGRSSKAAQALAAAGAQPVSLAGWIKSGRSVEGGAR